MASNLQNILRGWWHRGALYTTALRESKGTRAFAPLVRRRVLLIVKDVERAAVIEAGLAGSAYQLATVGEGGPDLSTRIRAEEPAVIVIDTDEPTRAELKGLATALRERPLPAVIFAKRSDPDTIEEAIRAGVSGYVVDGLHAARVVSVLDVAIARFNEAQALRDELARAKSDLGERKIVERAKGLLMEKKHLSEDEAYRTLRKLAMDQNKRLAEVAQQILLYSQILDG